MTLVQQIGRWFRLQAFWASRSTFYRELAQSILDKELLRDFVRGELEISLAKPTHMPARARGLQHMRTVMDSGVLGLGEVLAATMPATDHLALAILRETSSETEQAAILGRLAHTVQEQAAMVLMIRRATYAPLFLLAVGFVVAMIFSKLMIPAFEQAAPPDAWTGLAQFIRQVALGFSHYGIPVFLGLLLALLCLVLLVLPNAVGRWRFRAESAMGAERLLWTVACPVLPVQLLLKFHRDIEGGRMLVNLAGFLQAGWGLQDALQGLGQSASPWMRRHLAWILEHLQLIQGDYVGAFSHGVLSTPLLTQLHTRVRRDVGANFSQTLVYLSQISEQTTKEAIVQLTRTISLTALGLVMGVNLFFSLGQIYLTQVIQEANTAASVERRLIQRQSPK